MKSSIRISVLLATILLAAAPRAVAQKSAKGPEGTKMNYIVSGKDTMYLSEIAAARIYEKKPRKKGKQWRQYYKLVYNFAKVYPYALAAKDIVWQVDSTIKKDKLKYVKKDRYVGAVVKDLFHTYEKPLRNLTINQGGLLMKLIDRECGILPYDIIKEFKNSYAAVFWQGIARMFSNNLKKHYDPKGEDKMVEELVKQWENGTFERTYFEIFGEFPQNIELKPCPKQSQRK